MKSLLTIIAAMFLTVASFANRGQGSLNVTSMSNNQFRVVVDGRKYDMGNTLFLNNLSAGYHDIKIYEVTRGWASRNRMVYSSNILFRPDAQMNISVGRSGQIAVAEQNAGRYDNRDNDRRYDRNGQGGYGNRDDRYGYGQPGNAGDRNNYPQRRY